MSAPQPSGDADTFVLHATVPIKPGREDEYLGLVNAVNDEMRHEPTFVNTILHRSMEDPALFMLYETWRDRDDFFAVQMKRPYRATYEARLPDLLRAPRAMTVFEAIRTDHADESENRPMSDTQLTTPVDVVTRFYAAENAYMNAGGGEAGASFADMAATLDPEVVLHQSPDLPWGGEFHGHAGYEHWALRMSAAFDRLEVKDTRFFNDDELVIIICRLVTRARVTGETLELPMTQMVRVKGERIIEFRPFYWNVSAYRSAVQADGPKLAS